MLGAIIGDIVGSRFEFNNHRSKEFELFTEDCSATDDSMMTLAVAKAILECGDGQAGRLDESKLSESSVKWMRKIGRKRPNCGFGGMFNHWIFSDDPKPYNSFGNGAAMRVSPCGFIAGTEDEAKSLSRAVTAVTHNHEEGLKGAEAATVAVFMARSGATKGEIRDRIERDYYKLDFTLDGIRDTYKFSATCQETVPQAIEAFLESTDFEDCVRNAVSIGGDSDTLAAIACAIAEACYGVPAPLKRKALTYLDEELREIISEWERRTSGGKPAHKFDYITKYIGKLGDEETRRGFYQEFRAFVRQNPKYELNDYQTALEKGGLKWTEDSMKSADAASLDERTALALILGAARAERFEDGVLETFITNGCIDKCLVRLRAIDGERESAPGRPALRRVKISLWPFKEGNISELLLTEGQVVIKTSAPDFGSVTQQYEISEASGLGEASLAAMTDCLDADGWHDAQFFHEIDFAVNLYELEAEFEDGKTVVHRGIFDRAHMPEKQFTMFAETISVIVHALGFGGVVGLSGFKSALKKDEVKYCGVEFCDGGKIYYYRTDDLRIEEGDEVIVPVGKSNDERVATVKTVEFYRLDDTPYPLARTKEIIRPASDDAALLAAAPTGVAGDAGAAEEGEDD